MGRTQSREPRANTPLRRKRPTALTQHQSPRPPLNLQTYKKQIARTTLHHRCFGAPAAVPGRLLQCSAMWARLSSVSPSKDQTRPLQIADVFKRIAPPNHGHRLHGRTGNWTNVELPGLRNWLSIWRGPFERTPMIRGRFPASILRWVGLENGGGECGVGLALERGCLSWVESCSPRFCGVF